MTKKEKDILFQAVKDKLGINRREFDNFFTLSKKASDKVDRLAHSPRLIEPPQYVAKTFNKIQTREDFDRRIDFFEKTLSPNYISERNKETDQKFYDFLYDIADGDLYTITKIYNKYKNLPIYKKAKFYEENADIRKVLYYKTEYDDELAEFQDWTVYKLLGRLEEL